MGDVVSLVERAVEVVEEEEAHRLEEKMRRGQFTLEDFLEQMRQMRRLGSLETLVQMLPGGAEMVKNTDMAKSEREFRHMEGVICAMTLQERRQPQVLNARRRLRIANGSGVKVSEVNTVLHRFAQMQQMFRQMGKLQRMLAKRGGVPPPGLFPR
jgi:signal recognition particle subunit SRP54